MRKILLLLIVAFAFTVNSNAQGLDALFGKLKEKATESSKDGGSADNAFINAGKDILGGVVNNIVNGKSLSAKNLAGEWTYQGISCKLESEDLLVMLASEAVEVKLEETLDAQLLKLGVSAGKSSVEFDADGNCTANINGNPFHGTYTIGEDGKSVVFAFLMGQITLNSVIEVTGNEIDVTFDADKLLAIIKNVLSTTQQATQSAEPTTQETLKLLSTIVNGYDGLRLGLKLVK